MVMMSAQLLYMRGSWGKTRTKKEREGEDGYRDRDRDPSSVLTDIFVLCHGGVESIPSLSLYVKIG